MRESLLAHVAVFQHPAQPLAAARHHARTRCRAPLAWTLRAPTIDISQGGDSQRVGGKEWREILVGWTGRSGGRGGARWRSPLGEERRSTIECVQTACTSPLPLSRLFSALAMPPHPPPSPLSCSLSVCRFLSALLVHVQTYLKPTLHVQRCESFRG